MKSIEWDKCKTKGSISDSSKPPDSYPQVKPNMTVSATFQEVDVRLKIIEEVNQNEFKASVICFDHNSVPIVEHPSKQLFEDDEVIIKREDICWVSL